METHNIISTPEITGNIGSCTTQMVTVTAERMSFWKQNSIDIATNSCTGEASEYQHWEYTEDAFAAAVILLTILSGVVVILGIRFIDWLETY